MSDTLLCNWCHRRMDAPEHYKHEGEDAWKCPKCKKRIYIVGNVGCMGPAKQISKSVMRRVKIQSEEE
jgi:hypothetical protein